MMFPIPSHPPCPAEMPKACGARVSWKVLSGGGAGGNQTFRGGPNMAKAARWGLPAGSLLLALLSGEGVLRFQPSG